MYSRQTFKKTEGDLHCVHVTVLYNFFSVLHEFCFFCASCFLKKRTLWSLERALSLLQHPPQRLAPEPQGSTLRLWSTAPKTLALLMLKVPSGALCPTPPCLLACFSYIISAVYVYCNTDQVCAKTSCCAFFIS